jgi:large subunit ribosomal protein L10
LDRKTKEQVVAELNERLRESKLTVLAGYSGMKVEKIAEIRNALRKTDSEFRVVKNTLLNLAARNTEASLLSDHLKGPLAISLSKGDVLGSTRCLVDFAKKNQLLELKCGVMGGKVLGRDELVALSELPSREILLGKLLSVMVGVQTSLVRVLSAVPGGLVQVLNGYREKKEAVI